MFTRTNSGLSNRARFTGSQFTLYVEGGGGVPGAGSVDVVFWNKVFARLRPDLKLTIKAHGGKPELETMAKRVESNSISNTIVAMDSDYDDLLDEKIQHDRVLYTYGYSWESDVYCSEVVLSTIATASRLNEIPDDTKTQTEAILHFNMVNLLPFINADFRLRALGSSLFPTIKPGRYIRISADSTDVEVDFRELLRAYRQQMKAITPLRRRARANLSIISPHCFLHGHTLQYFIRCVCEVAVRHAGRNFKISDDFLEHVAIPSFADLIADQESRSARHYRSALNAL